MLSRCEEWHPRRFSVQSTQKFNPQETFKSSSPGKLDCIILVSKGIWDDMLFLGRPLEPLGLKGNFKMLPSSMHQKIKIKNLEFVVCFILDTII